MRWLCRWGYRLRGHLRGQRRGTHAILFLDVSIDFGPRALRRVTATSLLKSTSNPSSLSDESITQYAHRARHISNKISEPSAWTPSEWVSGAGDSDKRNVMMRWTSIDGKAGWLDRTWMSRGPHRVTEKFGGKNELIGKERFLRKFKKPKFNCLYNLRMRQLTSLIVTPKRLSSVSHRKTCLMPISLSDHHRQHPCFHLQVNLNPIQVRRRQHLQPLLPLISTFLSPFEQNWCRLYIELRPTRLGKWFWEDFYTSSKLALVVANELPALETQ